MPPTPNAFIVRSDEHVDDVFDAEPLLDSRYARQNFLREYCSIGDAFDFAETKIAGSAIRF